MPQDNKLPDLKILHEDNHLLAVYKPAGMLVQADSSGDESLLELAREWVRIKYAKPGNVFMGLVHRLDRPVSGVVLFAKTSKAASRLCEQFRERDAAKSYLAVVHGQPKEFQATLTHYLRQDEESNRANVFTCPPPGAKEARLSYKMRKSDGQVSELEVVLHTGRKHQIRAQLAKIGCSIVGDVKYGSPCSLDNGHAIALHAFSLAVKHPTKEETVEITAPLPDYWPIR